MAEPILRRNQGSRGRFVNGLWIPDDEWDARGVLPSTPLQSLSQANQEPFSPPGLMLDPEGKPIPPPVGSIPPAPPLSAPSKPHTHGYDPVTGKFTEYPVGKGITGLQMPWEETPGTRSLRSLLPTPGTRRATGGYDPMTGKYQKVFLDQEPLPPQEQAGKLEAKGPVNMGVGIPPLPQEALNQISPEVRQYLGMPTTGDANFPPDSSVAPLISLSKAQPAPIHTAPVVDEEQAREKRIRRLEALQGLSEGLMGMGRVLTPAMLRSGIMPPDAGPAMGTRKRIAEEEDFLDPSERQFIKNQFNVELPSNARRSRIYPLVPQLATMRHAQTAAVISGSRFAETAKARVDKEMRASKKDIVSRFNGDPSIKKVQDIASGAQTVLDLINTGDSQAIKNAVVPLARLLGEKGALSDQDRAEIRTRLGITQKIEDWVNQKIAGDFTPEFVQSLKIMATTVEAQVPKVRARIAKERAAQYAKATGIPEQELMDMILPYGPESGGPTATEASAGTTMVLPDGQEIPGIHPSQVGAFQATFPGSKPR